jgi:hypothetical protein
MKPIDPTLLSIFLLMVLILSLSHLNHFDLIEIPLAEAQNQREKVTLSLLLSDGERWDPLLDGAKTELQKRHPDKIIEIQNKTLPYEEIRPQLLEALTN